MPDSSFAEYKLSEHRGKYVVLFFWSLDFTFVCSSEIIAHNNRVKQLQKLNTEIVGISIDSHYTHLAWRNIDEMVRMVDVLQFSEQYGEVCPAGWNKVDEGMKPTAEGVASYLKDHAQKF